MYKQRGLSLIELMIAMALGLVLMAGVIQMFLSSRQVFSTQQALSRVQESGRLAVEFIAEDIRMAGFMGCLNRETEIRNDLDEGLWNDFTRDREATGLGLALGIEGYAVEDLPEADLDPEPLAGTDVLVSRYAGGVPSLVVEPVDPDTEEPLSGPGKLFIASVGDTAVETGANLLVSNCVGARIFTAIDVGPDDANVLISHEDTWPGATIDRFSNFYAGAEVLPISTVVYYVAENPIGRPSLYRREGDGQSLELIEGIENMSLRFGLAGDYVPADELNDEEWEQVNSVRIEFLAQSNEASVLDSPQSYRFAGATVAGPADRRMRQVFRTTIAIRSRVN
jgi:type IV pilus assembly protein PilW